MKHYKAVLNLLLCALLFFVPSKAFASVNTTLTLTIPFSFQNNSAVAHTCTAVMELLNGAPSPDATTVTATSGSEGAFTLHFSHSGTYQYRVYQTNKNNNNVVYDERVYTVTVAVRKVNEGLASSMWITQDGVEKLDAIAFINSGKAPSSEPGTTTPGDNPGDEPSSEPGVTNPNQTDNSSATKATKPNQSLGEQEQAYVEESEEPPLTGDNKKLKLYVTTMVVSALVLALIVASEHRKRKTSSNV